MRSYRPYILTLLLSLVPAVAFAAPTDLKGLADLLTSIIGTATLLLITVGGLLYMWNIASSLLEIGESHKTMQIFRDTMGWGLLALFLMVSLWGILRVLQSTFGFTN